MTELFQETRRNSRFPTEDSHLVKHNVLIQSDICDLFKIKIDVQLVPYRFRFSWQLLNEDALFTIGES